MNAQEFAAARQLLTEERVGRRLRSAQRQAEAVEEASFEASKAELARQRRVMEGG